MSEPRHEPSSESGRPLSPSGEPGLDRLTRLAAQALRAPIALITLVDGDRHGLQSAFDSSEPGREPTPFLRAQAFIERVVLRGRPLVVRDARDHPALAGRGGSAPSAPATACLGVPMTAAGCLVVGAFCVIDHQPRAWTDAELELLQEFAEAATSELRCQAERAELVRAARRSAIRLAIASILAEASTIEGAVASILQVLGERLDLDAAEFWTDDGPPAGLRRSRRDWFSSESGRLYLNRSRELDQAPPWVSAASGGTVDLEDEIEDLKAAVAAPLAHEGRRHGVMTFVGRERPSSEAALEPFLAEVGREIGRFIARRRREDDVRDFAAILEQGSDMIVLATPGGRVRHLNAAGRALSGYRTEAPPDDLRLGDLLPQFDLLAAASEPFSDRRWSGQTILNRPRTGRKIAVDASLFMVRDPGTARPTGMAAIVRDARARTRDEALLLEGKARLRGILEASLDALVTIDHEGDVAEFNPAAERIFGLTAEATIGRRFAELIADDVQRAGFEAGLRAYVETRSPEYLGERREIEARRGDGMRFPAELTVAAVALDGPPVFTASLRDISRQKQAEGALRRARDEALASSQAKAAFLANMSHEVRTPMSAVLGYADVLLDPALPAADRLAAIQAIRRNGAHLLQIINDILDLSKIEAGRMRLEPVACSPWRVALEVASGLRVRADERGIVVEVEAASPLPESARMDPTRVRQILVNLIGNAIKFSEPGGRVSVRLSARRDDASREGMLWIEVKDQGIGVPADQLEGIFTPFHQADTSSTRKFGGTGLGLSISRRLAEAMEGGIDVQSTLGEGSRFTVGLPLRGVAARRWLEPVELSGNLEAEAEGETDDGAGLIGATLSGRILLVEDSLDNQRVLLHYLTRIGVEAETAGDGRIGVDRALAGGFDLVLLDMQLPVLDGYNAARTLRQAGFEKPIIALTAHAMADDRDRCLRAGCTDYLTKPIEVPRLFEALGRVLPRRATAASSRPPCVVSEHAFDPDLGALVERFVASLPSKVAAFQNAIASNDPAAVQFQAHQLRGVGSMYGFPEITETCGLLEEAVRENRDAGLIAELADEFAELCEEIGRRVATRIPQGRPGPPF